MGLVATAFADGDANTNVIFNVNVTGGTAGGGSSGSGAPSVPSAPSAPGGSSSSSSSSGSGGISSRQIRYGLRLFCDDLKKELKRELNGTEGELVAWELERDYSGRRIYEISVKSDKNPKVTCYLIAIPKGKVKLRNNRITSDVEVFFSWNYNANNRPSEYNDDWLITPRDQFAEDAIPQFVEKLLNGEVVRPQ
ncbi:hypothetical protein IK146_02055 [Candidatus Saccharibacteria bacterium]|nr:hypothetical protein [Candidatus Saccharibacteria bacterium]